MTEKHELPPGGEEDNSTRTARQRSPIADAEGASALRNRALIDAARDQAEAVDDPMVGGRIGPYHILQALGEGGFGIVYLAERREPHVQRVALKVIKPGMDSKAVIARFEQERQALAVMDHPCVARVFDAGATDRGQPYFVMEHVGGEPITAYCDRNRLTTRHRLELFTRVCDAVQHAHTKGIIHRDLKPSNVLVIPGDAAGAGPTPKVIDFGVAKAISRTLTDKTIFTEQGQIIGTPEYMSPEQAEMNPTNVDTRSDVYSLGVMLYELLAGALPFDPKTLRAAGYAEIQRIIREIEAPRPSARLSGLGDAGTAVAERRRTQAGALARELGRELEWIPLKALRKDRNERYGSPADLARDIRNYLADRALEAGPESAAYRLRKLVRQNRGFFAAAGAVAAALMLGVVGFAWQAHRISVERDRAERLSGNLRTADRLSGNLRTSNDFLQCILASTFTGTGGTRDMRLSDAFKLASARLPGSINDQPEQKASLFKTLANVHAALGDLNQSKSELSAARSLLESAPDPDAAKVAAVDTMYAGVLNKEKKFDEAEPLLRRSLAVLRLREDDHFEDLAETINHLGEVLIGKGQYEPARGRFQEVLALLHRHGADEGIQAAEAHFGQASVYFFLDTDYAAAERETRRALEIFRERTGPITQETLIMMSSLAGICVAMHQPDRALAIYEDAIRKFESKFGEEHPSVVELFLAYATQLDNSQRYADAETVLRRALKICESKLPQGHPLHAEVLRVLAINVYAQPGRNCESEKLLRDALAELRLQKGLGAYVTRECIYNLINMIPQCSGNLPEAEALARELLAFCREAGPDVQDAELWLMNGVEALSYVLTKRGAVATDEYEKLSREDVELSRRIRKPESPLTLATMTRLADALESRGKMEEALPLIEQGLSVMKTQHVDNPELSSHFTVTYARCAVKLEKYDQAQSALLEAPRHFGPEAKTNAEQILRLDKALADLYTAWDKAKPGKSYQAKAVEWRTKTEAMKATTQPATSQP